MENNHQDETLLARWLAGALTPEELEALQQREDYPDLVRIIEGMEGLQLPPFQETHAWQRLQQKLAVEKKTPSAHLSPVDNPDANIRKIIPWRRIAGIAAILAILALGLWWLAGNNSTSTSPDTSVATATGERKELSLPDGSHVTLNALSTLEYHAAGWENRRELKLVGEAFFKVKKGKRFVVLMEQGKVEVIGTQFNTYARNRELEVQCTEGKVQVTNLAGTERVLLKAGEQVSILDGKMQRRQGLSAYPTWFKGESTFRSAPLERVFGEMERQYGIVVVTDSLNGRSFSGKFVHQNLDKALRMVCTPMKLTWTVEGDTVRIGK